MSAGDSTADDILIQFDTQRHTYRRGALSDSLGQLKQQSEVAMNLTLGTIRLAADRFARAIREIERDALPEEVEVEFGVTLELEGGVDSGLPVAFIAKGTAGAQFLVRMRWEVDKPQQTQVLISS